MHAQVRSTDRFAFAAESAPTPAPAEPWKILIADDEEDVHRVTRLALAGFTHAGRPLAFLDAYSGAQAVDLVGAHPDIALVLMDVVMESEHAGLNAVLAIRNDLRNRLTRVVIRTGQPGRAPEADVVGRYEISDYREKTEITARKLQSVVANGLSLYRELAALNSHKESLEQVVGAAAALQSQRSEEAFARSALQQLAVLLYADAPRMPSDMLLALRSADRGSRVLAGTGYYAGCGGRRIEEALSPETWLEAETELGERAVVFGARRFVARAAVAGGELLVFITGEAPARAVDPTHVSLFCRHLASGFDNLRLKDELQQTQHGLVQLLAAAVEQRRIAGAGHSQRVGATVRVLGRLMGLDDDALERVALAATLHDVGHLAIPPAILDKREPLTEEEQALYETHTHCGHDLLAGHPGQVLQLAALIAAQHHERWDGQGYPAGLAGPQIHLYARLTAVADALDELTHGPAALPLAAAAAHIDRERGCRFDAQITTLLVNNLERLGRPARTS